MFTRFKNLASTLCFITIVTAQTAFSTLLKIDSAECQLDSTDHSSFAIPADFSDETGLRALTSQSATFRANPSVSQFGIGTETIPLGDKVTFSSPASRTRVSLEIKWGGCCGSESGLGEKVELVRHGRWNSYQSLYKALKLSLNSLIAQPSNYGNDSSDSGEAGIRLTSSDLSTDYQVMLLNRPMGGIISVGFSEPKGMIVILSKDCHIDQYKVHIIKLGDDLYSNMLLGNWKYRYLPWGPCCLVGTCLTGALCGCMCCCYCIR
jgi:hypothetical protein